MIGLAGLWRIRAKLLRSWQLRFMGLFSQWSKTLDQTLDSDSNWISSHSFRLPEIHMMRGIGHREYDIRTVSVLVIYSDAHLALVIY